MDSKLQTVCRSLNLRTTIELPDPAERPSHDLGAYLATVEDELGLLTVVDPNRGDHGADTQDQEQEQEGADDVQG